MAFVLADPMSIGLTEMSKELHFRVTSLVTCQSADYIESDVNYQQDAWDLTERIIKVQSAVAC